MVFGGGTFWRWLDPEGGALMNGISVLIKEIPESSFTPFTMWEYLQKTVVYELGSEGSPDTESTDVLPSLQNFRINFCYL